MMVFVIISPVLGEVTEVSPTNAVPFEDDGDSESSMALDDVARSFYK
jgi:hypothetical protein